MSKLKYFYNILSWIGLRYKVVSASDLLERKEMNKKVIYAVGGIENYWCLTFLCPCGCKEIILLNSLSNFPTWSIDNRVPVSIKPSINRTVGCKSHFWIINGCVKYV